MDGGRLVGSAVGWVLYLGSLVGMILSVGRSAAVHPLRCGMDVDVAWMVLDEWQYLL
jgi:hypothetical protein